jgi:hypothetical protein
MNRKRDERSSCFRLFITVVLDWRLVMAVVLLVLALLRFLK